MSGIKSNTFRDSRATSSGVPPSDIIAPIPLFKEKKQLRLFNNGGKRVLLTHKERATRRKNRARRVLKYKPSHEERDYRLTPLWEEESVHQTERRMTSEIIKWETRHKRSARIEDITSLFEEMDCKMECHSGTERIQQLRKKKDEAFTNLFLQVKKVLNDVPEKSPLREFVSLIESLLLTFHIVLNSTSTEVMLSACLLFIKSRMGNDESLLLSLNNFVVKIFGTSPFGPQSGEEPVSFMRFCKEKVQHPMFEKMSFILSLLVTVGFIQEKQFSFKGFEIFKTKAFDIHKNASDIIDGLFSTCIFFIEKGYACYAKGSLSPLWMARDEMVEFDDNVLFLQSNIDNVRNGNLYDRTGMREDKFELILEKTRDQARDLYATAPNNTIKGMLGQKKVVIDKIRSQFYNFLATVGMRAAPYCVCCYGASSVGKTTLATTLMSAILKHSDYEATDKFTCNLQNDDKFYSTFHTSINGIYLDDMCNTKPDKSVVNSTARLIELVNNSIQYAPKAAVEEKGACLIRPKVVMITTNSASLDAEFWSIEPVSIVRRINVRIIVKVKPIYAANNGKLSAALVEKHYPRLQETVKDIWDLTLQYARGKKTENGGHEEYDWVTLVDPITNKELSDVSIYDALKFILPDSAKYYLQQDNLVKEYTEYSSKFDVCKTCCEVGNRCTCICLKCMNSKLKCTCVKAQSGIETAAFGLATATVYKIGKKWAESAINKTIKSIFPSSLEWKAIQAMETSALYLNTEHIISSPFITITQFIPNYLMRSDQCTWLYMWLTRHNRYKDCRNMFMFLTIPCVFLSLFLTLKLGISLYLTFIVFLLPAMAVNYAFSLKWTYHNSMAELKTRQDLKDVYEIISEKNNVVGTVIKNAALVAVGLVLLKTIHSMWKYTAELQNTPQSSLDPETEEELNVRNEKPDIYAWKPVALPQVDSKMKTRTVTHVRDTVDKQLMYISFKSQDKDAQYCNALFIDSGMVLMPRHIWFPDKNINGQPYESLTFKFVRAKGGDGSSFFYETVWFTAGVQVAGQDMMLFHVAKGGTFADLSDLFSIDGRTRTQCMCTFRNMDGVMNHFVGGYQKLDTSYQTSAGSNIAIRGGVMDYSIDTYNGMCNAISVSNDKMPCILGIHIAGETGKRKGAVITLYRSDIAKAREQLRLVPGFFSAHSSGTLQTEVLGTSIGFRPSIEPKAPISFIGEFYANVYGSCDGAAKNTSKIRSSILCPLLEEELGFKNKWGKPKFSPEGRSWKPWYDTLVHLVNPRHNVDPNLLDWARRDYMKDLIPCLSFGHIKKYFRPLTYMETINGIDGVRFIDALNMQSSIGFPLGGAKEKFMEQLDPELYPELACPRAFVKELKVEENLELCKLEYLAGRRCHHIFKACLKDETTKLDKDKVRVFESAPLLLQLLLRMYFLPIIRFLSMFPLKSECAVGINCYGGEWDELHNHITKYGTERILAGDYSKWDLRLPCHLVGMAFDVMIRFAKISGNYSSDDIKIMEGIATDVIYPFIAYNGSLIELFGSNPSGQNLTAHLNSICNSLLMRMAFRKIEGDIPFRKSVAAVTYGDDIISGVATTVKKFNHISVRDFLAEMDIDFTMPDKTSEATEYMDITDADFLKRRSIFNPEIQQHVGALDVNSIYKSLFCYRFKPGVSEENVMAGVVQSALFELVLHGEESYTHHHVMLTKICSQLNIVPPNMDMTYADRIHNWKLKYEAGYADNYEGGMPPVVGSVPDNVNIAFEQLDPEGL